MTTIRAGLLVLALVVAGLDAGFWFATHGPHQTARVGFVIGFVLVLALLTGTAALVRWEVAAPIGAAAVSGLFFVGATAIFSVGLGFLLAAVVGAALVRRLVLDSAPPGRRGGTWLISLSAAVVPAALLAMGLVALK